MVKVDWLDRVNIRKLVLENNNKITTSITVGNVEQVELDISDTIDAITSNLSVHHAEKFIFMYDEENNALINMIKKSNKTTTHFVEDDAAEQKSLGYMLISIFILGLICFHALGVFDKLF